MANQLKSQIPSFYSNRFVAFIDVLGFGSLVSKSGKNQSVARPIIKRISKALIYTVKELEEHAEIGSFVFTQFSDSFVISATPSRKPDSLFSFTLAIMAVIDSFLISHLLLRGGITRGRLIHTDKSLFGPAMNRAYEIESQIAKVPRIVIDPTVVELGSILPYYLRRDTDGLMYINYFDTKMKAFYVIPGWLLRIQQIIRAIPNSRKLEEKRLWMMDKYNERIANFSYKRFKSQLDEYLNDGDFNPAVPKDYDQILGDARNLHRL